MPMVPLAFKGVEFILEHMHFSHSATMWYGKVGLDVKRVLLSGEQSESIPSKEPGAKHRGGVRCRCAQNYQQQSAWHCSQKPGRLHWVQQQGGVQALRCMHHQLLLACMPGGALAGAQARRRLPSKEQRLKAALFCLVE